MFHAAWDGLAEVIGRTAGDHGHTMGSCDENPLLNSIIYDVDFFKGYGKECAANILAENMISQVELETAATEGHH